MKRGIRCSYHIMVRGKYGLYYEQISGRKIILKKDGKLLYVGYRKTFGRYFEFTDLETGFLIYRDANYIRGIERIFANFDELLNRKDETKQSFLKEVNQLQYANHIFGNAVLYFNESAVIVNV